MRKNPSHAFTLIELLVVITIIAVLASIAYPVYTNVQERARATQDMSNLRQLGLATQMYLNDNDGVLFAPTTAWATSLSPKYIPSWKIFRSAFDTNYNSTRPDSEDPANAPVSYGLNLNAKPSTGTGGLSVDKIKNTTGFVLFAPAQNSDPVPHFQGKSNATVTVFQNASDPGGTAAGGTHSRRTRINVCFADYHQENYPWSSFNSDTPEPGSTGQTRSQRWHADPTDPASP